MTDLAVIEGREIAVGTADVLMRPGMMTSLMEFAEAMSRSKLTVPKHFQGSSADCLAIVMQATQWGMNPFAVAQKTHIIHGVLGYEAQLVNAVVSSSSAIIGRFRYEWLGNWETILGRTKEVQGQNGKYSVPDWKPEDEDGLGVAVSATIRGDTEPTKLTLLLKQATVRNSTLWAADPKQQLAYLAVKRWARLYTPDVLLGVYTPDELQERVIDVAPVRQSDPPAKQSAAEKLKTRVKGRDPAPQLAQPDAHGETQADGYDAELAASAEQLAERIGKAQANDMKALVAEMERFKDTPHIEPLGDIYRTRAKFLRAASAEAENNG